MQYKIYAMAISFFMTGVISLNILKKNTTSSSLKVRIIQRPVNLWWEGNATSAPDVLETFGALVFGKIIYLNAANLLDKAEKNQLVEDVSCSKNVYFLTLKKDQKFHNGRLISAYDLEFSLLRQLLTGKLCLSNTHLFDIAGIKEILNNVNKNGPQHFLSGMCKGIKVLNSHQLKITLVNENPCFLNKLSTSLLPIVPQEDLTENYLHFKRLPVGMGNYRVKKADNLIGTASLEKIDLDQPGPTNIDFIEAADDDSADIKLTINVKNPKEFTKSYILPKVFAVGGFRFNYQTDLGKNENFRKAIYYALDRKKLSKMAIKGIFSPEDQLLPKYGAFSRYRLKENIQEQDVEKATPKLLLSSCFLI